MYPVIVLINLKNETNEIHPYFDESGFDLYVVKPSYVNDMINNKIIESRLKT